MRSGPLPGASGFGKILFLVSFGLIWFGLVPCPLLHLAAFAMPSSVTQLSPAHARMGGAQLSTFSLFHPVLRLQTSASQPLAKRETKKRKNFSFGAGTPRNPSQSHSGTLNSQPSTLNSQLLQPPSV